MYTILYIELNRRFYLNMDKQYLQIETMLASFIYSNYRNYRLQMVPNTSFIVLIGQCNLKVICVLTEITFPKMVMKCALLHTQCMCKITEGSALPQRQFFYSLWINFYPFATTINC